MDGEIEQIHWDAFGNFGNFEIEVSYNNGITWNLLGLVTGEKRSWLWEVPKAISNQIKIRVKRNNIIGESIAPFSIYETPQNVHIAEVCPDFVRLEWDPVANAQSYQIYKLGEKFMESFTIIGDTFFEIPINDPSIENWYAVAAMGENGLISRRSIAVSDGSNLLNCDLGTDISVHSIATPSNSILATLTVSSEPSALTGFLTILLILSADLISSTLFSELPIVAFSSLQANRSRKSINKGIIFLIFRLIKFKQLLFDNFELQI